MDRSELVYIYIYICARPPPMTTIWCRCCSCCLFYGHLWLILGSYKHWGSTKNRKPVSRHSVLGNTKTNGRLDAISRFRLVSDQCVPCTATSRQSYQKCLAPLTLTRHSESCCDEAIRSESQFGKSGWVGCLHQDHGLGISSCIQLAHIEWP